MKRLVKGSTDDVILTSPKGYFQLVEKSGVGANNTPWSDLEVLSTGLAEKHVVEIRLEGENNPKYNGEPVTYVYQDAYIAHGIRTDKDTLEETIEYIDVLLDAVDFIPDIKDYLESIN